jgi:rhodanese-related sulfurtransferase
MARIKTASPHEVLELRGTARLVDVREPAEFVGDLRHVSGAELVPLATVLERAAAWPKDAPLVCICRSGNRSGRAAEALVAMGFVDVTNMAGGMLAWNEAGLPVA